MLRLPPDVHEALVEAAQHKSVSLNHEIVSALRIHLDPQMVTWELQEIRSSIDEVVEQRLQEVSWKKSA